MTVKAYLIGRSGFDIHEFLSFLQANGTEWNRTPSATEAEELVEAAGRVCYMSFGSNQSPKSNEEYIRHLINMGHESVLEHVSWSFMLEGVSRAFTHQLVRHRVGFAFSQLSQQYHDESETTFVEPAHLRDFPTALQAWQRATESARETYRDILRELKQSEYAASSNPDRREVLRDLRSIARSVLPNATESKIVVTANARALRHFLRLRGGIPGDTEMRLVSAELLRLVKKEAPSLFFDFSVRTFDDGLPIVEYRRQAE